VKLLAKKRGSADNQRLDLPYGLVREPAAEDIGEFQVMFRMSTDSFDGPLKRFPQHTACLDGPSIDNV